MLKTNDDKDLVTVIDHLTVEERDRVKGILDSLKIPYIVNGHGSVNQYHSHYYSFKVRQRDYGVAIKVVKEQKARIFIDSRRCPKCKTLGYRANSKKGLWEKIFYFGTTLVECSKCKHKFGI